MALAQEVANKGLRLEKLVKYHSTNEGYEVFAPEGSRFTEGVHSRVFYDAGEVRTFLQDPRAIEIELCEDDCDCKA